ncbi:MAG: TonB-dependent receptor [Paludibacteraceae bacterium]|nr:TonB-dependent receptor [Paludibacteraceae bacterium]
MKKLFFTLILAVSCLLAVAEDITITGTVIDNDGVPLVGATILVKGTSLGTVTDIDGHFTIAVPADAKMIVVSMVGMETQEVMLNHKKTNYAIRLAENTEVLEDVVVIGYTTVQKRDLTGSVSSVSGKTLSSIPIANTESALAGRMAGVHVIVADGAPDADVQIRVRGGGSITQDNNPLYIVDGFPMDNISDISASDIESIDVLKDASATAIYGARGANGVVIITTKSAKAGRTQVSYNGYFQTKHATKKYDVLNSYEYVKLQYELNHLKYNGEMNSFISMFGDTDDYDIYKLIPARDSQDEMYGRWAIGHSHNLSINGGNDKTKFNVSFTYLNEEGVMRNSSQERYNLNFKLNHDFFNRLRLDLSAYYTNSTVYGAGTSGNSATQIKNAVSFRPVLGKNSYAGEDISLSQDDYEDIEAQSELYDPITLIDQDYKRRRRSELNANVALTWKIIKHLNWKSEFGIMSSTQETRRFYGPITSTGRSNGRLPVAELSNQSKPRWRTAHTLSYKQTINKIHNINVVVGFEATSQKQQQVISITRLLPADIQPEEAFSRMQFGSQEYTTTLVNPDTRLASFFGRAQYTLMDRYLFTATIRADGSSKFAKGHRWGVFPSGAFAWRLSGEDWMQPASQWLDDLKLRISYGAAGNNRIDDDLWRKTYIGTVSKPYAGFGNNPTLYYTSSSDLLTNPDLKWETTVTRNAGFDIALFRSRLTANFDIYYNTTRDLLLQSIIPESTGYSEQQKNIGQTSNRGLELTINGVIVEKKNWSLSVGFNIGTNCNRVDKLVDNEMVFYRSDWASGLRESDDFILKVGEPTGLIYGYITDGFYTVDDYDIVDGQWVLKDGVANDQNIVDSHWSVNMAPGMPNPGTLKLRDLDGDGVITKDGDRTVIGNTSPKCNGGFNINAKMHGVDISAFFTWSYGNQVYNANNIQFSTYWKKNYHNMLSAFDSAHRFRYIDDDFRPVTDPDALRALNQNATLWNPGMKVPVLHSWAIEDGSFLRLSNLVLGYTLPDKVLKKMHMSTLRFYGTVNNVFCLTKYSGFDPEVNTRTATPLTPGVDYSSYPKARSFTVGINATF